MALLPIINAKPFPHSPSIPLVPLDLNNLPLLLSHTHTLAVSVSLSLSGCNCCMRCTVNVSASAYVNAIKFATVIWPANRPANLTAIMWHVAWTGHLCIHKAAAVATLVAVAVVVVVVATAATE